MCYYESLWWFYVSQGRHCWRCIVVACRCSSAVSYHDSVSGGGSGGGIVLAIDANDDASNRYSIIIYDDRTKNGVIWSFQWRVMVFATTATPMTSPMKSKNGVGIVLTRNSTLQATYYDRALLLVMNSEKNEWKWPIISWFMGNYVILCYGRGYVWILLHR
jgi:hypothetical protein